MQYSVDIMCDVIIIEITTVFQVDFNYEIVLLEKNYALRTFVFNLFMLLS